MQNAADKLPGGWAFPEQHDRECRRNHDPETGERRLEYCTIASDIDLVEHHAGKIEEPVHERECKAEREVRIDGRKRATCLRQHERNQA